MYVYEVDGEFLLHIPFAGDEARLGVTGEDLLKAAAGPQTAMQLSEKKSREAGRKSTRRCYRQVNCEPDIREGRKTQKTGPKPPVSVLKVEARERRETRFCRWI